MNAVGESISGDATGQVVVRLPGVLRELAEGQREVRVPVPRSARVADVLDRLVETRPVLARRLRDETGALRRHVNVYVDGEDVRRGAGLAEPVAPGAVIDVLPSIAGGSSGETH
ncbi:MAG TPA: ubiquitin-like small modifier protein 1 [Actinomycetes bacterium]|nr:ubiquitin-like small modifier protein 1 [Actinomycetes bacterium]